MVWVIFLIPLIVTMVASKTCVPAETTFYWTTPCQGQSYPNLLTVTNLTATQNGISVDKNGGLNLGIPIDLVVTGVNTYGSVAKPLMNIAVYHYSGVLSCDWTLQPTFGSLNDIDACTIITSDCHFTDPTATTTTLSINMKTLLGGLLDATVVGDYYSLAVTLLDDKTPLQCIWSQDKVIAK